MMRFRMLRRLSWDIRPAELERLPRRQRRWLERCAFEMFRKDHRFAEWIVCGLCVLGLVPGYWVTMVVCGWFGIGIAITDPAGGWIWWMGGGLAGAGVGGWLGRQWLLRKIRPYLRRMT